MGCQTTRPIEPGAFYRSDVRIFDEFLSYTDAQLWTKLAADATATVAHEGTAGGKSRLKLFTDTTDNNECAVKLTNKMLKFLASKEIVLEGLIQYAEANTNTANVAFGSADAIGANLIADNGGAIAVTDGLLIYKKDGDTVWSFHTEINGAGDSGSMGYSSSGWNESTSTTTAGGSNAQLLRIDLKPISATVFQARPYVDGKQLVTTSGVPIMHQVVLGTSIDQTFGVYAKTGAGNAENIYVDYLLADFVR